MEESWLRGDLADIPFPQLLFRIWQREKSGYLNIRKDEVEKKLYLKKGELAVEQGSFSDKDFLKMLVEKNLLDSSYLNKYEDIAAQNKSSLTKALIELRAFSPSRLWKLMEVYFKEELFPLFDWPHGEYFFHSENLLQESEILFITETLDFILQGVRRMKNYDLIEAHIPPEESVIQIFQHYYLNQIKLEPPEKYLLNVIDNKNNLKTTYELSQLGKKESQKILFGLLSLSIIGFPQKEPKEKLPQEVSFAELYKILDAFNNKCVYIYKYISKEIGPVALNVLRKCLEETKESLSPLSQKMELGGDGRIKMNSILKANISLLSKEDEKVLIRDLNEILAAEVLAVKKTLGNKHEAILVENLKN